MDTQTLIAAVSDLLFYFDKDGKFIDFKAERNDLLMDPKDFLGKHYRETLPPTVATQLDGAISGAKASGKTQEFDYELTFPDGTMKYYKARVAVSKTGEIVVAALDTTVIKKTALAVSQSEEQFRAIAESAPNYIVLLDKNIIVTYINRVASYLDKAKVIGASALDFVLEHEKARLKACYDGVLATGTADVIEVEGLGPNGTTSWFQCNIGPLYKDGAIIGMINIITDMTVQKQKTEELEKINAAMVGREVKMAELKKENAELKKKPGGE